VEEVTGGKVKNRKAMARGICRGFDIKRGRKEERISSAQHHGRVVKISPRP